MDNNGVKKFVKERDEALLSLDKDKIMAFMDKYNIPVPRDETVFWAGIHKAIINTIKSTADQKINSIMWLTEHGFSPYIK